jgi:hypothetical protein
MEIAVVDGKDIVNGNANIPASPGVYAWYKRLSLDDTTAANFKSSVVEMLSGHISGKAVPPIVDGTTKSVNVQVSQRNIGLTRSKARIVDSVRQDANHRQEFTRLVLRASVLQPPLYVGETSNLHKRIINDHATGKTGFAKYIIDYLEFSEMVCSYIEVKNFPQKTQNLMEALIACASAPLYSGRMG